MSVKLGDKVQDKISGFKGVATARHRYLNGCDRITVQPKVDEEGKLPSCKTFDEPDLVVLKKQKVKIGNRLIGGPEKYSDSSRPTG